MNENYRFKNEYIEMYIQDGILWVVYSNNVNVTAEKARLIVSERLKVANGRSYPTLADCGTGQSLDKKSREIFGGEDAMRNVTAGAIIIRNTIQRMFINAYFWFAKLPIPHAAFPNEQKALKWLEPYKNTDS
jgi:hypothetical protein